MSSKQKDYVSPEAKALIKAIFAENVEIIISDGLKIHIDEETFAAERSFIFLVNPDIHPDKEEDSVVAIALSEIPELIQVLQNLYDGKKGLEEKRKIW